MAQVDNFLSENNPADYTVGSGSGMNLNPKKGIFDTYLAQDSPTTTTNINVGSIGVYN